MRIEASSTPRCPTCRAPVASGDRWCGGCGAPRDPDDPPGTSEGRSSGVADASLLEWAAPLLAGLLLVAVVLAAVVVVALTLERSPVASSATTGTDDVDVDGLREAAPGPRSSTGVDTDGPTGFDAGARPTCVAGDDCLVWTVEHPGRGPVWRDVHVDDDLLVLTDRLGTTALAVDDGSTRWRIEADPTADNGARGHAVSDSLVLLIERDGVLRSYDRATGDLRWISPLPAALRVRHAVDHGDVVVVVADGVAGAAGAVRLVAGFDRDTGARRWLRQAGSAASTSSGPVVFDGPRSLRGLDPDTGVVRWETAVQGPLGSVVGVGAAAVYVGWQETVIVDAASGGRTATRDAPPARIATGPTDAVVLLGDDVVQLVTSVGPTWTVPAPPGACCAGVIDDAVVVVDGDGGRTVLAGADGSVLARHTGRRDGVFVGAAWLAAAEGDTPPGRQIESDPVIAPIRVFDARGGRGVATTPPGIAIVGLDDGVVIAGAGWVSRIRTD